MLISIGLAAFFYVRGLRTIWPRAGTGHGVRVWQAAAYAAGMATLCVALVSPLDALSADLFAAHMVQHLLLILVAAPLLVASEPLLPLLWVLPRPWRRRAGRLSRRPWFAGLWRTLCRPPVAWLLAAAVLWLWHLPVLYQAALRNGTMHAFEHACLLGTALLFWYVLAQQTARRRHRYGAGIVYVLTMAFQSSILGIVLAFSRPWYPAYAATTQLWHLTPAEDQQIAGLIMWIPAGVVYLLAVLALIVRWVAADEAAAPRLERTDATARPRPAEAIVVGGDADSFARLLDAR
ncbi:MAG: cytochrome c oxidase assembly protein [Dehalococcoidia bacterium]